jgi:hypothetical protein
MQMLENQWIKGDFFVILAELFHQLTKSLEILTDAAARVIYNFIHFNL